VRDAEDLRSTHYEGHSKDYEFSRLTMEEHWRAGYHDGVRTLRHLEVLERPSNLDGAFTFDLGRDGRECGVLPCPLLFCFGRSVGVLIGPAPTPPAVDRSARVLLDYRGERRRVDGGGTTGDGAGYGRSR